jgi:hypothetical protein
MPSGRLMPNQTDGVCRMTPKNRGLMPNQAK